MDDTRVPATSFTVFPDLPFEIRLKIWSFVTPAPRDVTIKYTTAFRKIEEQISPASTGWISSTPVPVILQICRESRAEALKSYQLSFGTVYNEPRIYFNFAIDSLSFGAIPGTQWTDAHEEESYLLDVMLGGSYHGAIDAEKVRYMSFDVHEDLYARISFCWDEIREMSELEELTLKVDENEDAQIEDLMVVYRNWLTAVSNASPEWAIPRTKVLSVRTGKEWKLEKMKSASELLA